jgi:hypothetical protein
MHAELWRRRLSKEVKSAKDPVHRQRGTSVGDQSSSGKRSGSGHMVISVVYRMSSGTRGETVYDMIFIFLPHWLGDLGFQAPDSPRRGEGAVCEEGL